MATNLSPQQIEQEILIEILKKALHECALEAKWLVLEITEHSVMRHTEITINILKRLQALGYPFLSMILE